MHTFDDPMLQRLHVTVTEQTARGITVSSELQREFYNIYDIAHGGFLYTLGHMAACLSGQLCLGGNWEVSDITCQYLEPLRRSPAKAVTEQVGSASMYRVCIYDAEGLLCHKQMVSLRPAGEKVNTVVHGPKLAHLAPPMNVPRRTFAQFLHIYPTTQNAERVVYSVDLDDANTDGFNSCHPGAMFTAADAATSGELFHVRGKQPLTVSASMHYLHRASAGPVSAVPHLNRGGKTLFYYDVDLIDGEGTVAAIGQFIVHSLGERKVSE